MTKSLWKTDCWHIDTSSWFVAEDVEDNKSNDCDESPVANLTHSSSVWMNASHVTPNIDVDSSNFWIKKRIFKKR